MRTLATLGFIATALACFCPPASADLIIHATHTDHALADGGSLDNVILQVALTVSDGWATFLFTNASIGPETSVVFKEIVLDTYDDDTGVSILWGGLVLTDTPDVKFSLIGNSNGLPGYGPQTRDEFPLIELQAGAPPTRKGLNIGESLEVRFQTSLADGSGIADYLAAFGGGADTGAYSIGFHGISASTVNGESLSGIFVPEPSTLAMLSFVGLGLLCRRRS